MFLEDGEKDCRQQKRSFLFSLFAIELSDIVSASVYDIALFLLKCVAIL